MTREYDKLVRDRIPELIRESGEEPVTHVADDAEFERRLGEKLVEEAREYEASGDLAELADVLAVVAAIRTHRGVDDDRLADLREAKADERGAFGERIVLDRVEQDGPVD